MRFVEEVGRKPKSLAQSDAEVHRYNGMAIEDTRDGGARYSDMLGELGCGSLAEELLQQFARTGRIVHHRHGHCPSVVILIIDEYRILALKGEGQPPVAADSHRPVSFEIPFQRMPAPTIPVHIQGRRCQIQGGQLDAQSGGVFWLDARPRASPEKLLDAAMAESPDHCRSVTCTVTLSLRGGLLNSIS